MHQLRDQQTNTPSTSRVLDDIYLSDLVSFSTHDSKGPDGTDRLCLFVSMILVWRLGHSVPSWPAAVSVFRAGLICLRSTKIVHTLARQEELDGLILTTLSQCSEYLSRLCAEFKGLGPYRSCLDAVTSIYRNTVAQAKGWQPGWSTGVLPTTLDRQLAAQASQAVQTPGVGNDVFMPGMHQGLSRLVSCITLISEEEHNLHGIIFGIFR